MLCLVKSCVRDPMTSETSQYFLVIYTTGRIAALRLSNSQRTPRRAAAEYAEPERATATGRRSRSSSLAPTRPTPSRRRTRTTSAIRPNRS